MKTLNKVKMSIWINALSAIAIGILFLINPQESFEVVTIIAGIIITATGIIDFIYYLNYLQHMIILVCLVHLCLF